jgi:hypothetical protein
MIELREHPFFIASQFHPEFKSRPTRAHPLFRGLVAAAVSRAEERGETAPSHDESPTLPHANGTTNASAWSTADGNQDAQGMDEDDDFSLTIDDIRRKFAE